MVAKVGVEVDRHWAIETVREKGIIEPRRAEGLWRQKERWSDTK
jgi:hypothetical protein